MKALGITAAVLVVGGLLSWFLLSQGGREQEVQAPPPVEAEPAPAEPAELALPPELEEELEEVEELEPEEAPLVQRGKKLTKPEILGRTKLPDGRVEVRILSPIYYGDGTQKNVIRVLRAKPRYMKADLVQQRPNIGRGKERVRNLQPTQDQPTQDQ